MRHGTGTGQASCNGGMARGRRVAPPGQTCQAQCVPLADGAIKATAEDAEDCQSLWPIRSCQQCAAHVGGATSWPTASSKAAKRMLARWWRVPPGIQTG
ncbi:hypothetical protein ON010_g17686 [Phytophthora cinnamomi]|nr:hypothetical protein ON010_g17686 [Phytophthora cinnamomi]